MSKIFWMVNIGGNEPTYVGKVAMFFINLFCIILLLLPFVGLTLGIISACSQH